MALAKKTPLQSRLWRFQVFHVEVVCNSRHPITGLVASSEDREGAMHYSMLTLS